MNSKTGRRILIVILLFGLNLLCVTDAIAGKWQRRGKYWYKYGGSQPYQYYSSGWYRSKRTGKRCYGPHYKPVKINIRIENSLASTFHEGFMAQMAIVQSQNRAHERERDKALTAKLLWENAQRMGIQSPFPGSAPFMNYGFGGMFSPIQAAGGFQAKSNAYGGNTQSGYSFTSFQDTWNTLDPNLAQTRFFNGMDREIENKQETFQMAKELAGMEQQANFETQMLRAETLKNKAALDVLADLSRTIKEGVNQIVAEGKTSRTTTTTTASGWGPEQEQNGRAAPPPPQLRQPEGGQAINVDVPLLTAKCAECHKAGGSSSLVLDGSRSITPKQRDAAIYAIGLGNGLTSAEFIKRLGFVDENGELTLQAMPPADSGQTVNAEEEYSQAVRELESITRQ